MYKIYKRTNKINGKVYIGLTKRTLEERAGKNGYEYKDNPAFYAAIQKYGWNNFESEILEDNILTKEEACQKEKYYIKLYNSTDKKYGYNLTPGGEYGFNEAFLHSEKHREATRERSKKRWEDPQYRELMKKRVISPGNGAKKVFCIELNQYFDSIKQAARETGISKSQISRHINNQSSQAGKHPETGEPLHWKIIEN